jgi:serine protease AprX
VIDSGLLAMSSTHKWSLDPKEAKTLVAQDSGRCLIYRDFLPRTTENGNSAGTNSIDQYGHGTHVTATIADNRTDVLSADGQSAKVGVAPDVNLMVARALDKNGSGTYSAVINAIEWVLRNQNRYNVRVLNLSLYAPVGGPYWADPLNQEVMAAWRAGIVVVAAAGNQGPDAGTITVPGNVPYVITVGAIRSGRYSETGQDELAPYSSRGPTESAFVKPDVLIPGSRTIAPMPSNSTLALQFPDSALVTVKEVDFNVGEFKGTQRYYQLSGTSMATAQVSGIVALMLQAKPSLAPDQVKYRLLSTARRALIPGTNDSFYYSAWEQGAGMVDAEAVIGSIATERANEGMDIALDLDTSSDPQTHYWGNTTWDEASGEFQLVNPDTDEVVESWDESLTSGSGYRLWSGGYRLWSGGYRLWSGGYRLWSGGTDAWTSGYRLWSGGYRLWSGSTGSVDGSATLDGCVLQTP